MDAQTISEVLNRQPFQPFRLKFSNQETVDVTSPAFVVVMKRDIFIAAPSRDRFHICALIHVVDVESLQTA